jgi:regulatory protein YycI of two-component signal transduction system YycFG
MASIVQTLATQENDSGGSVSESLQSGLKAGVQLATAKEQVETAKVKLQEQKSDLIAKQAGTANSLLTNLARANPAIAKKMLKTVREKLINLGVDPDIADYTISDDANRKRQIAFSQMAGNKLTQNPNSAQEYMQGLADLVGYDQAAQMFDAEFKRRQQDKQFAIQMSKVDQAEAKAERTQAKLDDRLMRQETQALSKRLEADSVPEVVNSIKQIDKEVGGLYSDEASVKFDKIAGSTGWWAGLKIPFTELAPLESALIADKDKPLFQAVAALRNNYLKLRSGGAVTSPEADRFLQELGQGNIRSGKDLQNGIQLLTDAMREKVKTIEAGYTPEAVKLLAERGAPVSSKNIPSAGQKKEAVMAPDQKLIEFEAFLDKKQLTPEQKKKALEQFKAKQATAKGM